MTTLKPRLVAMGTLFVCLMAAICSAQELLFTNTFQSTKEGSRPKGWEILGPKDATYWYVSNGEFCTGNGDDYTQGNTYALIDDPKARKWNNYVIRCNFWMSQTIGSVLLVARWQDPTAYYLAALRSADTPGGASSAEIMKVSGGQFSTLRKVVNGQGVSIPKFEQGTSAVDSRSLEFEVTGNRLTLSLSGKVLVEATDDSYTEGTAGLGQYSNFVRFDKVVVVSTTPAAPAAEPTRAPSTAPGEVSQLPTTSTGDASASGGDVYRLLIQGGLDMASAERTKNDIAALGYPQVEALQESDGKYTVYLGAYLSEQEAKQARDYFVSEGLMPPEQIVKVSGRQAEKLLAPTAAATEEVQTRYRVMAREWQNAADAETMRQNLMDTGYLVEVKEVPTGFQVLAGPEFINKTDADSLAADLQNSGFFESKVTEVRPEAAALASAAPAPGAPKAPQAELSPEKIREMAGAGPGKEAPSEKELAAAAEVLKLREAGRAGELSYEENKRMMELYKKLDERVQALVSTVEKKEQDQRNREIRIRELKAGIDSARDARNFDQALTLLDEWEKLDPNPAIDIQRRMLQAAKNKQFVGQDQFEEQQNERIKNLVADAQKAEADGQLDRAIQIWTAVQSSAARGPNYELASSKLVDLQKRAFDAAQARQKAESRQNLIFWISLCVVIVVVIGVVLVVLVTMKKNKKREEELLRQVQEMTNSPLTAVGGPKPGAIPAAVAPPRAPVAPVAVAPAMPPAMQPVAPMAPPAPPVAAPAANPFAAPSAPPASLNPVSSGRPAADSLNPPSAPLAIAGVPNLSPPSAPLPAPLAPPVSLPSFPDLSPPSAPPAFAQAPSAGPANLTPKSAPMAPPPAPAPAMDSSFVPMSASDLDALLGGGPKSTPPAAAPASPQAPPAFAPFTAPAGAPDPFAALPMNPPSAQMPQAAFAPADLNPPSASMAFPAGEAMPQAPPSSVHDMPTMISGVPAAAGGPAIPVPPAAEAPRAQAPAVHVSPGGVLYEQSFDDEADGAAPRGWVGTYDYASLLVSSTTPASGSKHCLRFEKRQGTGSAYYSCRFPEVGGRICVEFDLRCDDKNKYLLGFYIEKDEDFRQSIHTIVHRTSPQVSPTLRIQGEPVNYTLGTWRHIKYDIDLTTNGVLGFIDGEIVTKEPVKLASPPRSINTLSIRDNLATTGILLIDSIRIYKP